MPPSHIDYLNDCWLIATATFLDVSYYEAYVLMFGGPPPPSNYDDMSDMSISLEEWEAKLKKLGIVRARLDYQKAGKDRLVVGCYRSINIGYYSTLHAVVWDAKQHVRHDGQGYDTFTRRDVRMVRVFRWVDKAKPIVTGCCIPAVCTDATLGLAA